MGQAAVSLLLMGQAPAVLVTVMLPPVAMARRTAPAIAVALWGLALTFLVTWAVVTYRATIHADPADIEGDLLATVHWLGLALGAAVGCLVVVRRSSARAPIS